MEPTVIDFDLLERESETLRRQWLSAEPFEIIVIDGFCRREAALRMLAQLPDPRSLNKSRDYIFAKEKYEKNDFASLSAEFSQLYSELVSERFQDFLSSLAGRKVFVDPEFHGGGLHTGGPGSYLDMHADFNVHPLHENWVRELNILLYLNEGWQQAWGGELKLRNAETGRRRSVEPFFNRCVIMLTKSHTLHGYDPISFPPGRYRRSIAAYAYSLTDAGRAPVPRSTLWVSERSFVRRALGPAAGRLVRLKNRLLGSGSVKNR